MQVTLPSTITKIGSKAFGECFVLKEIAIPPSMTKIESEAFSGCLAFEQITIPSSVTEVCAEVFFFCSSLVKVLFVRWGKHVYEMFRIKRSHSSFSINRNW